MKETKIMVEALGQSDPEDYDKAVDGLHLASQYANQILSRQSLPLTQVMIAEFNKKAQHHFAESDEGRDSFGKYRTTSAVLTEAGKQPPGEYELIPLMKEFCVKTDIAIEGMGRGIHNLQKIIECASYAGYTLVANHPFSDGNGRVSRCLMDVVLRKGGLRRILIGPVHKDKYLTSLRNVDRTGNLDYFTIFLLKRLNDEYVGGRRDDEIGSWFIKKLIGKYGSNLKSYSKNRRIVA